MRWVLLAAVVMCLFDVIVLDITPWLFLVIIPGIALWGASCLLQKTINDFGLGDDERRR